METLRAVIYNRCSTEEESQKDALAKQVLESKNCVREQGWQLVDTYVEAKSGTTRKGRKEYNRLYQDLERDKFDIIVIKSQDRLMRNTKDWYLFLERLQKNRKRLYMYLENKFYTPDDALVTGIKAILAEEYSRELSKKINNAHRNRQKEGKSFVLTNQTYGFKKLQDKSIAVDEREAEMIRMIFKLSAIGYGTHCTAEILYREGYRNRNGKMLGSSSIRNIIRNPIYKGTVIQNRRHYDFESRQMIRNPQTEWFVHENVIPAIVDEDLFEEANRGLDVRKQEGNSKGMYTKGSHPGKYDLSGKIFCGMCKNPFYRTVRRKKSGQVTEWKCCNYLQNGRRKPQLRRDQVRKAGRGEPAEDGAGCDNVHLDEKKLYGVLERFGKEKYRSLGMREGDFLQKTLAILRRALREDYVTVRKEELETSLEKLICQKKRLLEKLLENVISDEAFKEKNQELQNRTDQIKRQLKGMEDDILNNTGLENRIQSIREKLEGGVIEQARMAYMIQAIRKIEIFPDCLEISFDSRTLTGLPDENTSLAVRDETEKLTVIRLPQTCSTSHQATIGEEKKIVLELMGRKPEITAKEIAEEMGVHLSLVHRRIRELKAEGKIRYSSPNGRGWWMIV